MYSMITTQNANFIPDINIGRSFILQILIRFTKLTRASVKLPDPSVITSH